MSVTTETILFEAVSAPVQGLSRRGMAWLCGLSVAGAAVPAVLFAVLGAWPVLGFLGLEVGLALGLVALHRSWARRAEESVRLTEARLRVACADGRGGRVVVDLDPYWARVDLREVSAEAAVLRLSSRGKGVEIGRFLTLEEKQDLARALGAALARYRTPSFDNPQLR
jgi:uncharacterized membrane protein